MLELLFLLLPIAAFYGYYMGSRARSKSSDTRESSNIRSFMRGINYFLKKDRNNAVDEFIKYYDSLGEHTFEESLALGALFRERGELERAIKFHTSMLTTQGLEPVKRSTALLELATDFMSAGLLSKAEEILTELISYNSERTRAVKLLIKLYQQEKEWHKALEVVNRFKNTLGNSVKVAEAQFYCELATDEYLKHNLIFATDYFRRAVMVNNDCARAYIKLARIALEQHHPEKAIAFLSDFVQSAPEMVQMALELLPRCFTPQDLKGELEILHSWLALTSSVSVMLAVVDLKEQLNEKQEAEEFLLNCLRRTPHVLLFSRLFNYKLDALGPKAQECMGDLRSLIEAYSVGNARYCCQKCGFKSQVFFWYCPSCHHWETMTPYDDIAAADPRGGSDRDCSVPKV